MMVMTQGNNNVKTQKYTDALKGVDGLKGMRIAVVNEGFGHANTEKM